jgi:hypothetical protein
MNHFISAQGPVAQWIARSTSNRAVAGSSPARVAFCQISLKPGPVAQWIARLTSDQAVAGSSPARVAFGPVKWGISSIGRVRRLQRRGTGIETRILHLLPLWNGILAEWLRR